VERAVNIDNQLVNIVEIDWEKLNWKRILTPEEERKRSEKLMRLIGGTSYDPRLLMASSSKKKPIFRIKRQSSDKLKGASSLKK
jgi:hypothetical protein